MNQPKQGETTHRYGRVVIARMRTQKRTREHICTMKIKIPGL